MRFSKASLLCLMASIAVFGREALAVDMEELLVPEPEESLVGGYNQLDDLETFEAEVMPQVVQAYKMQATMNNEMVYDGDFYVCEVQYQVVAGTNYIITVAPDEEDCEEGETAELKVFCPLAYTGELCQLTEPAVLPDSFFSE